MTDSLLIQMHGHPGSGKTTLAHALGRALPAVVVEMDLVTQALLSRGAQGDLVFAAYDAAHGLAGSLLDQGYSVVLDGPAYRSWVQGRSREVAADHDARWTMIECVCSDETMVRTRLASRVALAFQAREPGAWPPNTHVVSRDHAVIDTVRPLGECVAESLQHLQAVLA